MAAKTREPAAEGLLATAAKTIGKAAGKIAAATGVKPDPAEHPQSPKKGKLAPKNKARLPRRQKKAQKKKKMAA
ncbi:MAG TPA: hypothetical protein VKT49_05245 [Bryobacteraceae bacterium]|nr:hypothetical protein [Bryobacteraceae bacterium]